MSVDACATPVDRQPSPHASQPTPPVQQPVVASSSPVTPQAEVVTACSSAPQAQPVQAILQTTAASSTPQPCSSSQPSPSPAVICSSARMPSHISSSVASSAANTPPTQTSIAVPSSQHTPIISTAPQTSISQVQVPVSAHVSQNSGHQTTHLPNLASQMSVSVSQIPQVQVIQQPPATYHLQQLYHNPGQQMFLQPGNLTIQNMPAFQSTSGGLQLQLPNATGQMPISNVGNKTPIVSKALALSSISSNLGTHQTQMISSLKTGINAAGTQMIKPVLPSHQFATANSHQIVISPYGAVLPQHQQTILPANKTVLEAQKGKQFIMSHGTTIQPKSPILPTTAMTSQFKAQLSANQLITQASPAMITNQAQILSSFQALPQGLTWAAAPAQSIMGQNSSPIFIRGPGQQDIGFIQTSSPQLQTVSGNPIYVHPNGGAMQVVQTNQTSSPVTSMAHSFITTTTSSAASHVNNISTTSTQSMGNSTQHPTIAPAPSQATIRPKPLRPSVGTQTAASPSQQKLAGDLSHLKPIAAKSKAPVASKSTLPQMPSKPAASVVSTQTSTSQQQIPETVLPKPTNEANTTKVNAVKAKPAAAQKSSTAAQTTISRTTSGPVTMSSQTMPPQPSNVQSTHQVPSTTVQPTSTSSQTIAPSPQLQQSSTASQQSEETPPVQSCQVKAPQKEKPTPAPAVSQTPPTKPKVEKKDASTEQDSDLMALSGIDMLKSPPQKAIVKPQVLTHVIDGYIIQESPNPFPVNGKYNDVMCETTNKQDESISALNSMTVANGIEPKGKVPLDVLKCENCGKTVPKSKSGARKRKRFCSQNCFKLQNKQPKLGLFNPVKSSLAEFDISNVDNSLSTTETELQSDISFESQDDRKRMKMSKRTVHNVQSMEAISMKSDAGSSKIEPNETNGESLSSHSSTDITSNGSDEITPKNSIVGVYIPTGGQNPIKWSVQDVYDFVRNLPGCQEYADEFRSQEIDGQALMLLKEDHLMSAMSMKLGPALKICSKINALREKADAAKPM